MFSTPLSITFNFQGQATKLSITKGFTDSLFKSNLTSTSSSLAHTRHAPWSPSQPPPIPTWTLLTLQLTRLFLTNTLSSAMACPHLWSSAAYTPHTSLCSRSPCPRVFSHSHPAGLIACLITHSPHPHPCWWTGKVWAIIKDKWVTLYLVLLNG